MKQIVLFGSYAQGKKDLLSGLNILVIMDTQLDFVHRNALLYEKLALPVDYDLLTYTPEELNRLKNRTFFQKILKEGKVLFEKRT